MEMTIDDLIKDLQSLKPELRKLPVKIKAENGLLFEPKVKVLLGEYEHPLYDEPKQMIITIK